MAALGFLPAKPQLPFSSIVITGADGFVGNHLVSLLKSRLSKSAKLVLAVREEMPQGGNVRCLQLDVRDPASVCNLISATQPDLVIHLAAQASVGQSAETAALSWDINCVGTFYLARAIASLASSATMLFVSSAEVYGRSFNLETVTERSELRPQSVYARTKAAAEALLADVLPPSSRLIVARPSNHSGAGQDPRFVLPAFARQIARIEAGLVEPVIRVGNLEAERDMMDVRDVVHAYEALLDAAPGLPPRTTFNIASGMTLPIRFFLDRLLAISRCHATVSPDPNRMRASDIPSAALDATAIREQTGWRPIFTINNMLEAVLADQRAQISRLGS
jgi:GDP-4-dehydro-6-deoxy-D-mannose reductase